MINKNIDFSEIFTKAKPFNHIVIDDFLQEDKAESLLKEIDENIIWDVRNDTGTQVKWRSDWKEDLDVPPETLSIIQYFNSGDFLRWLSKTTKIEGLIPDPYLTGGGFNKINRGGTLAVHADGNWHDLMKVHRRLNLIIYLNKNWNSNWGGNLELWSNKNTKPYKCEKVIEPHFNRAVIFKTDDYSFHGHPQLISCPDTISRKSLILYYYTSTRPDNEVVSMDNKHRAIFHTTMGDNNV